MSEGPVRSPLHMHTPTLLTRGRGEGRTGKEEGSEEGSKVGERKKVRTDRHTTQRERERERERDSLTHTAEKQVCNDRDKKTDMHPHRHKDRHKRWPWKFQQKLHGVRYHQARMQHFIR